MSFPDVINRKVVRELIKEPSATPARIKVLVCVPPCLFAKRYAMLTVNIEAKKALIGTIVNFPMVIEEPNINILTVAPNPAPEATPMR